MTDNARRRSSWFADVVRDRSDGNRARRDRLTLPALAVLAAIVYVPLLLTSPGRVVDDGDPSLLLHPGRLLRRAVTVWDPHRGLGAVPDLEIGLLWPLGPFHWMMDRLGVPDWIAHRLWLGSILVAAGAGVLFLARTWRWRPEGGAATAFVYALSPYVVSLATRDSTALLAFAGLPWLLALAIRALRTPGWRHPALFALVVATVGSTDPAALVLVLLAPAGWIVHALWRSPEVTRAGAAWTATKIFLVTVAVNLWWLVGITVQITNGLSTRRYEETPETVARTSTAPEVLRGLGDWALYARDHLVPVVEPGVRYTQSPWLLAVTFGIVATALLGLGVSRWRNRVFTVGLLLAGTVVAVGAHPWTAPSPLGAVFKAALDADLPLAIRSPVRAVPLTALAVALGVGALVGASLEQSRRRGLGAMALACVVAVAALPPLWLGEFVPDGRDRPESVPDHWLEAAAYLDAQGDGTRVLEIPGAATASHTWGEAGGSVSASLVDRPHATRDALPAGSAAAADLLRALDLRLQEGTLSPAALGAVARLMNAGDVVTRNDLRLDHDDAIRPRSLWSLATESIGLGPPATFGTRGPSTPADVAPFVDPEHLVHDRDLPEPPAAAAFPVVDPVPIVHARGADHLVILSGDGAGIVDAAGAGLLDGDDLIRYSADLTEDPAFVRTELVDQRTLIVTDTNRAQAERWTGLQRVLGFTEQADGGLLSDDPEDRRLPVFDDRPGTRSVAEHFGVSARASGYGRTDSYVPEHRPVNAVDGDITTAWRVGGGSDPRGERIELSSETAIETDTIRLVQPAGGDDRWITAVDLRFDEGDATRVVLDERSRGADGQEIRIDERAFEALSIEIVTTAGARPDADSAVGFAEIGLDVPPTREYVRMPQDLLDSGGFRTLRFPLALVQTRQRSVPTAVDRQDEELTLARVVDLPAARSYRLTGTARLSAGAAPSVLDAITGRPSAEPSVTVTASSTIAGGLAHLPSNVLDGDPTTRWTSAFDPVADHTVTLSSTDARPVGSVQVGFVDDAQHSAPTEIVVTVDGSEVGRTTVPRDGSGMRTVDVPVDRPVEGTVVAMTFVGLDERTAPTADGGTTTLPVAVTAVTIDGWTVGDRPPSFDSGCRNDLVLVDGVGVPVRVTGDMADALRGGPLDLRACDDQAVEMPGGDRIVDSADGRITGIDIDQLVWCSVGGGAPCTGEDPLAAPATTPPPSVEVLDDDDATVRVRVTDADPGTPFWLVLGQSHEPGWEIVDSDDGTEHEPSRLVDGFANGFLVDPGAAEFELTMRYVPQNRVEIGLLLSVVGAVLALGLAIGSAAPARPVPIPLQEPLRRIRAVTWEGGLPTRRDAVSVGIGAAVLTGLVSGPLLGLTIGVLAGVATRHEGWRSAFTVLPAGLLGVTAVYVVAQQISDDAGHDLDWPVQTGRLHMVALVAVLLLVVDVVIDRMWERRSDFR